MVHNGIEYGMMQAFAEGVEILTTSELGIDVVSGLASWRQGSVVRSWLLDLLVDGLERNPTLDGIAPVAKDSGEGRWTVDEAVRLGVPAPVIAGSLWTRFQSQRESTAMKVVALLRDQFGGHGVVRERPRRRHGEGDEPAPVHPGRPAQEPNRDRRRAERRHRPVRGHRRPGPQEAAAGRLQHGAPGDAARHAR